jgi:broad specificity phosphatase PhoE
MHNCDEWPSLLYLVRHAESAGNVARNHANAAGVAKIDIKDRDVDVPLSARGVAQAEVLGDWFATLDEQQRPEFILTSPYKRATATAQVVRGSMIREAIHRDLSIPILVDERLREKELGVLDRLTRRGVEELYPEQAQLRQRLGKFYYRPPGGESWCDVILRLRSALHTMSLHYAKRRVLIVSHQVVVLCFRYLLEGLTESDLLSIDAEGDVANCSVTHYACPNDPEKKTMTLCRYNWVAPLREGGAAVTAQPDPNETVR